MEKTERRRSEGAEQVSPLDWKMITMSTMVIGYAFKEMDSDLDVDTLLITEQVA